MNTKLIHLKMFEGHDAQQLMYHVEDFINDESIQVVDIKYAMCWDQSGNYNDALYSYTIFYRYSETEGMPS